MAITVSYLGLASINGVDLSDHAKSIKLSLSQDTREVTAHGATQHVFRAGLSNTSAEIDFYLDHASGSVESTLRGLITIASSGFPVVLQKLAGSATNPTSTNNPKYTLTMIVDGDFTPLNETVGEVGMTTVKFAPYTGTYTVGTSATS